MAEAAREAWITGVGMVSCLGEGPQAHWQALEAGKPQFDETFHPPYIIHSLAPLDLDKQIPKKGDQRQMEPWQRIGTYAAGLALEAAGVKGNAAVLEQMDMVVCAGGGERDITVDSKILSALPATNDAGSFLNERLMSDLRPTLFLAQLSNLLAGNISIVHGVIGSSRTFMGEEAAGVDAARVALARIMAGQSQIALVGGSYNAERLDMLLTHELAGYGLKGGFRRVWERHPEGGAALGSAGAFLVLEERGHAERRGAKPFAKLSLVAADRSPRNKGDVAATLRRLWDQVAGRLEPGAHAIVSGASGIEPATSEERTFLSEHPEVPVRATGSLIGHAFEPQFPMNLAFAALAVSHGRLFASTDSSGVERAMSGTLRQAVVTSIGLWRGEGLGLVEAVN